MLSSPEIPDKKIQKPRLILKIFLALLVVYIGMTLVLHLFRVRQYDYTYRQEHWSQWTAGLLAQPIVDLAIDRKVSYGFDWRELDSERIDKSVLPLTLRSKEEQLADYSQDWDSRNLQRDLGYVREAAIIRPKNYSGKWSLVYCTSQRQVCEQSNLLHAGEVKVLLDGQTEMWGLNEDGQYIQLELVRYLDRNQAKDVLFVYRKKFPATGLV
jgi:hypothetical protein